MVVEPLAFVVAALECVRVALIDRLAAVDATSLFAGDARLGWVVEVAHSSPPSLSASCVLYRTESDAAQMAPADVS